MRSSAAAKSGSSTPSSTRRFRSKDVGTPASWACSKMRMIVSSAGVVGQAHARGVDPIRLTNHVHRHKVFVEHLERLPFARPSPQVPLSAVVHESEYADRAQGRIRNQPGHVHARILEVLHNETPVLIISHGAHERYIQAELRQRHGRVRRGSSSSMPICGYSTCVRSSLRKRG